MRAPHFLALDIGTSSIRSGIYDADGVVIPETMVKNERTVEITPGGGAELDAETAFADVVRAIDDVLENCAVEDVEYAAVSSFWHSIVGIDGSGLPTTPVFIWAETRPAPHVSTLRTELEESEVHNRTGCRFHSSYWPAKLKWLRAEHAESFSSTRNWISFSDLVALRLSDTLCTSISMASATGVFDIRKLKWDAELISYLRLKDDHFPAVAETQEQTFQLNEKFSKRWPKLASARWYHALGDGAANNVGAGCLRSDRAALMIGTSGAMRVAFTGEVPTDIPAGLWCYRIDEKRVIIGGALSNGGGLYFWLKKNFRLKKNDDKTEAKIESREPDGHRITFLPFFAGERSTGYHDYAKGSIIGLTSAHDKIDIVQAALESVAYRFADIYEQLGRVLELKEIIASGGALRESPVWTQMIADTLGRNLYLPDSREASSRGVVLAASEAAGHLEGLEEIPVPEGAKFSFSAASHEVYRAARKRHEKFYRLLIDSDGVGK